MNEIQIIQRQLATERQHFGEVAAACLTALDKSTFVAGGDFAVACAEYFAFAISRIPGSTSPPAADAPAAGWREFLKTFTETSRIHFEGLDALGARNPLVTEWRAAAKINADSIFAERARYGRFAAAAP